jgi:hypothetical protein
MTVAELIAELQALPQDALVVLQKDAEGNGHSPMAGFWIGGYRAVSTWSGDVGLLELTAEDVRQGFTTDDLATDGVVAAILYPVN